MVNLLLTLPITIAFILNGFGQLYYGIKLKRQFTKQHNLHNTVFAMCLWITAGVLYPFYYSTYNAQIAWFQSISLFCILMLTPLIIFLILFYQYVRVKKNPEIKNRRNINIFLENYDRRNKGKEYTYKTDLHRKALHLFPASVIVFILIFAIYIWDGMWNQDLIWGISGENYGRFLMLTAGFSGILIFAALDYVRLSYIFKKSTIYHLLPDNVEDLLGKAMKRKEIFEFTKPASLVLAMAPTFIFPFGVFCAAAMIATLGDGAASVIGIRFGKKNFPKNSSKTIMGYLAGFLGSFGVAIPCLLIFDAHLGMTKILWIALGGSAMFFIVDLLNLEIDDNMLNPILCGSIMAFIYFL
ncbi:MAG: hypothetical protein ACOC44_08180 [Promethearchaeia archaeon]